MEHQNTNLLSQEKPKFNTVHDMLIFYSEIFKKRLDELEAQEKNGN